jgi:hypothetical protein
VRLLQVRQAVLALQKFHSTRLERKKRLIEENPLVSLIIGLKKIPNKTRRPYRIPIPHSLYPPEETELCLFSRTDKKTTKELLEIKGVKNIAKVSLLQISFVLPLSLPLFFFNVGDTTRQVEDGLQIL